MVQVPANLLGLGSHPPGFSHLAPNLEDPVRAWLNHVQPAYEYNYAANCALRGTTFEFRVSYMSRCKH